MPDILLAIAKALAGVPGLAPVFNPLVGIREEEKAEAANAMLLERVSEGHEISREALDQILAAIVGLRQDNQVLREQVVGGFYTVLKLIQVEQSLVTGPERAHLSSGTLRNLEERVASLVQQNTQLLVQEGLVTREVLRDELVRLFSDDVKTLLAVAQPAGFPKGYVPTNVAPIQAYYSFLETCEGLENRQIARIADALARKKPGSTILRRWAAMYVPSDCEVVE